MQHLKFGSPSQTKHVARKRFGQHFLSDQAIIADIIDLIAPATSDWMIEIGPGLGALTHPLLKHLTQLTVIELDRDLAAKLRQYEQLIVIEADVLRIDFRSLYEAQTTNKKIRVVGNLPYNISSPILFHLLSVASLVQDQHFMLQKEVVDRIVAKPCTGNYGRLSVMLQWRYDVESVLTVPPSSFSPPPKVMSAIVKMVPRLNRQDIQQNQFSEIVKIAFSQRRKLLRHTLGLWLDQQKFSGDFDIQRRAEEVSVEEYIELARAMEKK